MVFTPKSTAKAFRLDGETMTVSNLHTPSGFGHLLSALGYRTTQHNLAPGGPRCKDVVKWVASGWSKKLAYGV